MYICRTYNIYSVYESRLYDCDEAIVMMLKCIINEKYNMMTGLFFVFFKEFHILKT